MNPIRWLRERRAARRAEYERSGLRIVGWGRSRGRVSGSGL